MSKEEVVVGVYQVGDKIFDREIKAFGKAWTKDIADKKHFQGQLWEECRCGTEPVYMPSHRCEDCINRMWGTPTQVCYAYFK